jgi:hypothetical protein
MFGRKKAIGMRKMHRKNIVWDLMATPEYGGHSTSWADKKYH